MNKAERLVYNTLLKEGYKEEDIKHKYNISPDFILKNGREIEVKRLNKMGHLGFSEIQTNNLKDNCEVWIINYENKKIIDKKAFSIIKNSKFYNKIGLGFFYNFKYSRFKEVNNE